jgi:hypothetical protein
MMATALKKITAKKKKPEAKPVPQRKSGAAKVLEEKHVGAEITDWSRVRDMDSAIYQNLRNYGYFYDHKDAFKWAEAWVKKNRTASELADFKHAEDWRVNTTLGGLCKMHMAGARLEEKYMNRINDGINAAIAVGKTNRQAEAASSTKAVKTSADILAEKISDFIADVEGVIDEYHDSTVIFDAPNYSVYNELKKIAAPKPLAQKVYDYYKPLFDEIEELIVKKTPDLVEGYKHLKTAKEKKDYLEFIKNIIDDCQKYMNAATASKVRTVRKARVKKKVPVEKLVARVKYQKESAEYKLTSVDPAALVGATEAYLFNTKYRHLIQLVASSVDGFSIKGTTVINIREESCLKKTLRKPEDVLKEIGSTTKARASKVFLDLKTKAAAANGRLNEETIILKVYR